MYTDIQLKEMANNSGNSKKISQILNSKIWKDRLQHFNIDWKNTRKLYHYFYMRNSNLIPKCNFCQLIEVRYVSYTAGYKQYCSSNCCNRSDSWKNRVKNSNLSKYGVTSVMHLDTTKESLKNTMIERYGVDNYSKHPDFIKKFKETCIEKYGVNHPMYIDKFKKKQIDTYIEKYGISSPNKVKEIKEKKIQTWLRKYGVSNPSLIENINVKKMQTRIKTENSLCDSDKTLRDIYYDSVAKITKENWLEYFYEINPRKLKRSYDDYHLDHIYSVIDGFKNNIPPEIIGHWTNLRLIPKMENIRKQRRSDKTLKQLLEDYNKN